MDAKHAPRIPKIATPPGENWIDVKFGDEEDLVDPLFGIQGGDGIDWSHSAAEAADLPLSLDTTSYHPLRYQTPAFTTSPSPWNAVAWNPVQGPTGAYNVDAYTHLAARGTSSTRPLSGPYEPFDPLFLGPHSAALISAGDPYSYQPSSPGPYACNAGIPIPQHSRQATYSEYSFGSESSYPPTASEFPGAGSCASAELELDAMLGTSPSVATGMPRSSPCLQQHRQQQQQQQADHIHPSPRAKSSASSSSFSSSSTSSSPTNSSAGAGFTKLSWIHCGPSADSRRLVTLHEDSGPGAGGKRPRGRKSPLTAEQKRNAAMMRVLKACESCRRRKEKCDAGVPCKACIEHYKLDHVQVPCRGKLLSDDALDGAPAGVTKRTLAKAARVDHGGF